MAGNANSGPAKKKQWRDALMMILQRESGDLPRVGRTNFETVVLKQVHMAIEGDSAAIRDIADRIDGKPAQAIIGGDDGDNPVGFIFQTLYEAKPS